jgi:predicted permease
MRSLRRFLQRLFNSAARRAEDERLKEEIEEHIALETAENLRAGLSPIEARRQAMLKFGGIEAMKQDYRAEKGLLFIENLVRDLRFAFRLLRKSPGFTAVAVVTLALAIGANAVVFGLLNAFLLRPLNLPLEQSLYAVERASDKVGYLSYPDYLDLRDRNRSFDSLAAYNIGQAALDTGENTSRDWVYQVSGNYFDALGVQPYLGRLIHPSDEHGPASAPYIVLTYEFWHNRFQEDRGVVGRVVQVNKHPFTVVGVTPPGFRGTLLFFSPAFFVPIVGEDLNALNARGNRWVFEAIGHLKPGVSTAQANADLNSIGSYLEKTYPKEDSQISFALARPSLYGDYARQPVQAFLAGLMLLAGLILLAACANLGTLFAARAADRSREVALRLALGGSRFRLLRQLFTEAMLISLIGGAVGLWGSVVVFRGLGRWQPFSRYPVLVSVNPDPYVYGVALLLAVASGLLFASVPVRQILQTDPYEIVKSGSTLKVGSRVTLRDILVVMQIAICAVLVTSSMVAVRGLVRSLDSNFGFDPRNAIFVNTDLNMAGYSGDKLPAMQKRMIDAIQAIPGVQFVGLISEPPLRECCNSSAVFSENTTDLRSANAAAEALIYDISPEYFQAAGTAVLSGRPFTWHDDNNAPRVAVVNREFVRKVFSSRANPIGGQYKMPDGTRIEVVGLVEDGKYNSLTEDPQPAMFLPILQSPSGGTSLVVRSTGERSTTLGSKQDMGQLTAVIRTALHDLDRGLPLYIQPWSKELDTALFPSRMATLALGVMGLMGAMLALTGVFGMAAYSVSKRVKELGIRMALGAQRKEVLEAALGRAFKLLALGSAAGLLLGILASRVLAVIVYQATPRDPLVLAGVVLTMALLGLLATWIPAQRALSIDPMKLLRED